MSFFLRCYSFLLLVLTYLSTNSQIRFCDQNGSKNFCKTDYSNRYKIKMSTTIQTTLENVAKTMVKQIAEVIKTVAPRHGVAVADVEQMTQEIMVGLGLVELKITNVKKIKSTGSVSSDGGGSRKRVVSKKMKEAYMKIEGSTEESLKTVIAAYKLADKDTVISFDAFCTSATKEATKEAETKVCEIKVKAPKEKKTKAVAKKEVAEKEVVVAEKDVAVVAEKEVVAEEKKVVVKKAPKEKKEPKAKKEKSGRFDKWNPTSTKLFKTIVEESGGAVTEELRSAQVKYIEDLSDEDFASASIQGHFRAFVTTKIVVNCGAGKEEKVAESDDDEDLEEIEFEDEKLLRGSKSGKIFRPTEEAGDVLIGHAGKGRFADI